MPILTLRVRSLLAVLLLLTLPGRGGIMLQIGKNFTGATSSDQPPDAALAVGTNHVVEFINGRFAIFTKATGANVQTKTDLSFWTSAGVSVPSSFVSDPQ